MGFQPGKQTKLLPFKDTTILNYHNDISICASHYCDDMRYSKPQQVWITTFPPFSKIMVIAHQGTQKSHPISTKKKEAARKFYSFHESLKGKFAT
jgi:hypothetical protein